MSLIVNKKIKKLFKEKGVRTSEEAMTVLEKEIEVFFNILCDQISNHVVADNLKTVKPVHIPKLSALLDSSKDL